MTSAQAGLITKLQDNKLRGAFDHIQNNIPNTGGMITLLREGRTMLDATGQHDVTVLLQTQTSMA